MCNIYIFRFLHVYDNVCFPFKVGCALKRGRDMWVTGNGNPLVLSFYKYGNHFGKYMVSCRSLIGDIQPIDVVLNSVLFTYHAKTLHS